MWLPGATRGKQGLAMMDIRSSETFIQEKLVQHLKICLKIRNSYYHPLRMWLPGATRGKQGLAMIDI